MPVWGHGGTYADSINQLDSHQREMPFRAGVQDELLQRPFVELRGDLTLVVHTVQDYIQGLLHGHIGKEGLNVKGNQDILLFVQLFCDTQSDLVGCFN